MKLSNILIAICFLTIAIILPTGSSHAQKSPSFDQETYYRLTTKMLGQTKALDVINNGDNHLITISKINDYSNQYWKISPLGDGYFRLTTRSQGPGLSLDVIHAGKNNQMQLGATGNYSGQAWLIKSLGSGYYRLTSEWQGPKRSLAVLGSNKNNAVELDKTGKDAGQYWRITEIPAAKNLVAGSTAQKLAAGQLMKRGSQITSSNRRYSLRFQTDGNLVFYGPNNSQIWESETSRTGETCVLQLDGNLVIYDRENHPMWSSETMGYFDRKFALKEWKPVKLEVSNAGVFALMSVTNNIAWSRKKEASTKPITRLDAGQSMVRGSSVTSFNRNYILKFQTDGNLTFYGPNNSYIWDAGTSGKGETCILQTDGNLVIYDRAKAPVWSSETMGYFNKKFATRDWKPVKLEISSTGTCALRSATNKIAWRIGEGGTTSSLATTLTSGQSLQKGSSVMSSNRRYALRFLTDGNLVFYGPDKRPLWDSKTGSRGAVCILQADGNLVIYDRANQAVWSSKTMAYFDRKFGMEEWRPVKLEISDIGVCALISATNNVAWVCGEDPSFGLRRTLSAGQTLSRGTGITCPDRSYTLKFRQDGNLVFFGPNDSYIWDTKTTGMGETCVLQEDGNLVIFDRSNQPVWSSKTMVYFDRKFGQTEWKPVKLEVSNSGICALVSATNNVAWSVSK